MTARKPTRAKQLGVTDEQYARMLAKQGGVCAICGNPPKSRRLDVDHNHRGGEIRGLLCFTCNHYLLGKYATPAKLRRAADYLEGRVTFAADAIEREAYGIASDLEREVYGR
jgi:hypothetical protein